MEVDEKRLCIIWTIERARGFDERKGEREIIIIYILSREGERFTKEA